MGKTIEAFDASEKEIENAILKFLSFQIGVLAFKVNTMGVYDQRGGFYRKLSKYVIPGTPDIIACMDVNGVGVFIGLEVKSTSGIQSKEQKNFQEKLQDRSNGFYFLVRSVTDAAQALLEVRKLLGGRIHAVHQRTNSSLD